jgi:hypothetical protein
MQVQKMGHGAPLRRREDLRLRLARLQPPLVLLRQHRLIRPRGYHPVALLLVRQLRKPLYTVRCRRRPRRGRPRAPPRRPGRTHALPRGPAAPICIVLRVRLERRNVQRLAARREADPPGGPERFSTPWGPVGNQALNYFIYSGSSGRGAMAGSKRQPWLRLWENRRSVVESRTRRQRAAGGSPRVRGARRAHPRAEANEPSDSAAELSRATFLSAGKPEAGAAPGGGGERSALARRGAAVGSDGTFASAPAPPLASLSLSASASSPCSSTGFCGLASAPAGHARPRP